MTTQVDTAPDIARARPLSDGEMTAARAVAVLAAALGLLGFVNSFRAVARAAQASFGDARAHRAAGYRPGHRRLLRDGHRARAAGHAAPLGPAGPVVADRGDHLPQRRRSAGLVRPGRARGVPRAVGGGRVPGRPRDPGPSAADRRDGDRPDPGRPLAARTAADGPAVAPDGAVGDPFLPGRAGPRAGPPAGGHRLAGHLRRHRLAVARPAAGPHPVPARRADRRAGGCPRRTPGPGHRRAGHGRRTRTLRRTCGWPPRGRSPDGRTSPPPSWPGSSAGPSGRPAGSRTSSPLRTGTRPNPQLPPARLPTAKKTTGPGVTPTSPRKEGRRLHRIHRRFGASTGASWRPPSSPVCCWPLPTVTSRPVSGPAASVVQPGAAMPSPAAATAVAFARAQLGKPYLWGGTGPGAFDCSGLVWAAYQSAG